MKTEKEAQKDMEGMNELPVNDRQRHKGYDWSEIRLVYM